MKGVNSGVNQMIALPFIVYMKPGKLFNLYESQFSPYYNGYSTKSTSALKSFVRTE